MATNNAKDLRARSIEIHKATRSLGKDIQSHIVNIYKHIMSDESNGDVTLATHFVTLLNEKHDGESRSVVRSVAIKNWFEMFAACTWEKEGFKLNKKMRDHLRADPAAMKENTTAAIKTKWNELTPEKPFQIFDLDAAIAALVKRANEKLDEDTPEGKAHKINTAKLEALKALAE